MRIDRAKSPESYPLCGCVKCGVCGEGGRECMERACEVCGRECVGRVCDVPTKPVLLVPFTVPPVRLPRSRLTPFDLNINSDI